MAKQQLASNFCLSPQDIMALNASFATADKNKDGQLDFPEFEKLFSSRGVTDPKELEAWFKCFDGDKSGKISAKEFVSTLSLIGRGTQEQKLQFLFELFDADKSGTLTKEEIDNIVNYIKRVVADFGEGHQAAASIDVSGLDANKDGKITKEEWVSFAAKKPNITKALNWKFSK